MIQHVAFEAPGAITKWAQLHNYPLEVIRIFAEQPLPPAAAVDFLVVLGGPMSANDPEEWLVQERALIKAVVADNKPMFGICLGAQQLAKAFHAQIVSTPKEVGWGKIQTRLWDKKDYKLHHNMRFYIGMVKDLLYRKMASAFLRANSGKIRAFA